MREHPNTIWIGNRGGIQRKLLEGRRRRVTDDRSTGCRFGHIPNEFSRCRGQGFERTGAIREEYHGTNRQSHFSLSQGEVSSGCPGDVRPGSPGISRNLPLEGRIDDPVGINHTVHGGSQHRSFYRISGDGRSARCSNGNHIKQVVGDRAAKPIVKLQLFDVDQAVSAFAHSVGAGICLVGKYAIVGDADTAIGIERKGVSFTGIAIDGGIDVSCLVAVEHFTNNRELARVEFPREHQLVERLAAEQHNAVKIGHSRAHVLRRGELDSIGIGNCDPHVEPAVTVDHVVASLAGQHIAAATTKQDLVRRTKHVDRIAIAVADNIGLVEDDNAVGFAALPGQRLTRQVVDQHIHAGNPVHPFLGQGIADRKERSFRGDNRGTTAGPRSRNNITTAQGVIELPTRSTLDQVITVTQDEVLLVDEDRNPQIGVSRDGIALVDGPVETSHAIAALHAQPLEHDVIARFGVIVGIIAAAIQNVVTDDRAVEEQFRVFAGQSVKPVTAFEPVIAFVTEDDARAVTTIGKVSALAAKDILGVARTDNEVLSFTAVDKIETFTHEHCVVTEATLVFFKRANVLALVGDDVIACTAFDVIDAEAALKVIVTGIAPERIVAATTDQRVITGGAAQHHVLVTGEVQEIVDPIPVGILADDQRAHSFEHRIGASRIGAAKACVALPKLVKLQEVVRGQHQGIVEVRRAFTAQVRIAHCQFSKRVCFQLVEHVQALRAAEVVEAVAILQVFHLHFEHEREGRAQEASERHLLFSQATDPEIDQVQAGFYVRPGILAIEEGQAVSRRAGAAHDQADSGIALRFNGRGFKDRRVLTIGRDEVDHRSRGLEVQREIKPAGIGLERRIPGLSVEVRTRIIERGDPRIAAAGKVERAQIERQPNQVVAQGAGDEFINFVANLSRHAADNSTRRIVSGRAAFIERHRVQERLDQANFLGC